HSMSEAVVYLADCFKLGNEERNELLPSGQQRRLDNRVGWARTHLTKAGLLETTKMSHFRITSRGLEALQEHPAKIDLLYLDRFPGHLEFRKGGRNNTLAVSPITEETQSPKENIENSYQRLR